MKYLLLITCILFLTSCTTKVTSIKKDVDTLDRVVQESDEAQGYLLVAIDTNRALHSLSISGEKSIELTSEDLKYGTNYILLALPSGRYYFSKIKLNKSSYLQLNEKHWGFDIKPNIISYAGDLIMETKGWLWPSSNLELVNRSSFAFEFMFEKFPTILAKRKIEYSGPGEDDFLVFLEEVIADQRVEDNQ